MISDKDQDHLPERIASSEDIHPADDRPELDSLGGGGSDDDDQELESLDGGAPVAADPRSPAKLRPPRIEKVGGSPLSFKMPLAAKWVPPSEIKRTVLCAQHLQGILVRSISL